MGEVDNEQGSAENGRRGSIYTPRVIRFLVAVILAFTATMLFNRLATLYIGKMDYSPDDLDSSAFRDGCALVMTLALPALLGGGMAGMVARSDGYYAAAVAFVIWCAAGLFIQFWGIPIVGYRSAHDRLLHFFIYNPLATLPFGAAGGWLVGQFSSGRFTLNDINPVVVPGSDD